MPELRTPVITILHLTQQTPDGRPSTFMDEAYLLHCGPFT